MAHRATIYTVRVYPRRKRKPDDLVLGNFDGSGTWLGTTLNDYLGKGFKGEDSDNDRSVFCESTSVAGHEVHSLFAHGQTGQVADIIDANNQLRIRQVASDTHLVRCASVFRLDPTATIGFWAVHVNQGRGAKSLVEKELIERFNDQYEDLTLKIEPSVPAAAFRKAVDEGRIQSVHLTRLEKPRDRATAATDQWVEAGEHAKLDLRIRGDHKWLKNDLVKRFLHGEDGVRGRIVKFGGIEFDKAKVAVVLDDGQQRTFNIEAPEAGHAFSRDLEGVKVGSDGEPDPQSLYAKLGAVIDEL